MSQHVRRGAALGAASALVLAGLGAVAPAPASAAPDPSPVANGVTWLSGQLTDGLIHNNQYDFDDLGLSVDTGLSLAELGQTATVDGISEALAPQVTAYYSYFVAEGKTHVSAGSLAKAAVFADVAGDDPTAYGEQDLVAQLADRVSGETASAGRLGDVFFPEEPFEADFANTIGQAFAVRALDTAGSTETDAATDFLLAQQCEEGFFRLDLGATTTATCDADAAAEPNTDATALAVLNLASQADDTDVDAALDAAVAWLVETQNADGSFGSDAEIATANANSTGLAGWALDEQGSTDAAVKAATWLRAVQADDFGPCTTGLTARRGAIAYDKAALATGRSAGITVQTEDQFRRATAQALPALRQAPAAVPATSEPTSSSAYVRAGSRQRVTIPGGAAPGQTVCIARGASQALVTADAAGGASGVVTLPAGTGLRTYTARLADGTSLGSVSFNALGARKLGLGYKKQVPAGRKQVLDVRGLAPRESVRVWARGKKVATRTAGNQGKLVVRFPVGAKPGKVTVKVVGQFSDRVATRTFRVVKGR